MACAFRKIAWNLLAITGSIRAQVAFLADDLDDNSDTTKHAEALYGALQPALIAEKLAARIEGRTAAHPGKRWCCFLMTPRLRCWKTLTAVSGPCR